MGRISAGDRGGAEPTADCGGLDEMIWGAADDRPLV